MNSKTFALLLSFISICFNHYAQTASCGDKVIEDLQRRNVKGYDSIMRGMNLRIKQYVDQYPGPLQNRSVTTTTAGITIPVVFHVVHPNGQAYGTGTNISYQQILSQLNALNAAFAKDYPSYNGQSHAPYAQNTDIQFCLASITMPSGVSFYNGPGGIEKGVMRYADNTLTNHQITTASAGALLGLTHPALPYFPFDNYLNIWIVSSIGGSSPGITMGYAPKPLMGSYPLDGVVMRSDVVGDNTTGNTFALGFGLAQGKVLVHEVGHYLNLMHIFEGGCAGANAAGSGADPCDLNGDMICDIEPCTTQNISCNAPVPNTCIASYSTGTTANDMIEDYMSYADDDCMNTFTNGQKQRMHATLSTLRTTLWQLSNLTATGIVGPNGCAGSILYVDIKKPQTNYCTNTPIPLSNATLGNTATSWSWTFKGGSPTIATTNSVSVTYTAPGLYYAKLNVGNGTNSLTDSIAIAVTSCTLDPKKLNRSNWLFGDSCSVSFASGTPVPNALIKQHQTMSCAEMSVSMSDSLGNLLFYSDGVDLWDNVHAKINTLPLFGWDLTPLGSTRAGTSVTGFMAFPLPKQANKYALICTPPNEIRLGAQSSLAKISCVIYDAVAKTISPYQSLSSPLVNGTNSTFLAEDICIVPHCNGVDYWIIARSYINSGANGVFYSFLFNQNGLNPNAAPLISAPFNIPAGGGNFKSNTAGNKLICNSGVNNYLLYNFNQATGIVSNEVLVPVTQPIVFPACLAAIFSPNDNYLFLKYKGPSDQFIQQVDVNTLSVVNTLISSDMNYSPHEAGYMEVGPDNNIYFGARNFWFMGQISNPNSLSASLGTPVAFPPLSGYSTGISLLNYVEADKPMEVDPLSVQAISCSSFSYSLNPCWNIYNSSWNFGDGSSAVNGHVVSHTYSNPGVYTVSLTLSYNGQSIPVYTKTIGVIGSSVPISGPPAICKGNTYINHYSTINVSGAIYNWSVTNATFSGPGNLSSVDVTSGNTGVVTLSLQVISGSCTSNSTKIITIDTIPQVALTASTLTCVGNTLVLTGSPSGGAYSGTGITSNTFVAVNPGIVSAYYTYVNPNSCSNTTSLSITVNACTGLNDPESKENAFHIYPNPTTDDVTLFGSVLIIKSEVMNSIGQLVAVKNNIHASSVRLELSHLAKGIYFIHVYTDQAVIVKKIVKE